MAFGYFQDGRSHLDAEVDRARLLLRHRLALDRAVGRLPESLDVLSRGFISPAATDLGLAPGEYERAARDNPDISALTARLDTATAAITTSIDRAADAGVTLPLPRLVADFGLSPVERDLLVLAITAELDGGIRRAFGFLNDDITRQDLDVELAARLLERTTTLDAVRDALEPQAPLLRHRLLVPPTGADRDDHSVLRMVLRPARRVVDHLRDRRAVDSALIAAAVLEPVPRSGAGPTPLDGLILPPAVRALIDAQLARATPQAPGPRPVLVLSGAPGTGRSTVARALAWRLDLDLLHITLSRLPDTEDALLRVWREARLLGALPLLTLDGALEPPRAGQLARGLAGEDLPVAIEAPPGLRVPPGRPVVPIELTPPGDAARSRIWTDALGRAGLPTDDAAHLGVKHRVSGGTILQTVAAVAQEGGVSSRGELQGAVDAHLTRRQAHRLGDLSARIISRPEWSQLVAPETTIDELRSLADHYRYRGRIMLDWGFDKVLTTGRGIAALFEGPPGTGKTMAAGIIAREFGMELFQVDLARIVSKYIGETEKNLGRIFDEAEQANAILLFDEADSLFGKRTDVKSSNDRHANLEVNYLLQKMDAYPGITVLTTNFGGGIDEAFVRRLSFRIKFPAPSPEERARLWPVLLPPELPLADDIDYEELADTFEMTGGHIRNAILKAAVLAAKADRPVTMEDLMTGARAEYRAMGRLVRESDPVF